MRSIALALSASLTWGFADFFGPLKGRKLGALRVLVYVQLGGLVVIALIVAIRGKALQEFTVRSRWMDGQGADNIRNRSRRARHHCHSLHTDSAL